MRHFDLLFMSFILSAAPVTIALSESQTKVDALISSWNDEQEEGKFHNDTKYYTNLPSFRELVALGIPAVNPILSHLKTTPKDWMLSLAVIDICHLEQKSLEPLGVQMIKRLEKLLPNEKVIEAKCIAN